MTQQLRLVWRKLWWREALQDRLQCGFVILQLRLSALSSHCIQSVVPAASVLSMSEYNISTARHGDDTTRSLLTHLQKYLGFNVTAACSTIVQQH